MTVHMTWNMQKKAPQISGSVTFGCGKSSGQLFRAKEVWACLKITHELDKDELQAHEGFRLWLGFNANHSI